MMALCYNGKKVMEGPLKEETALKEKIKLLDREMITLTDKLDALSKTLKDMEDIKKEIKAIKLFLGRVHPELKSELPEITKKLFRKS